MSLQPSSKPDAFMEHQKEIKVVAQDNVPSENFIETKKKRVVFILPSLCAGGAERVLITLFNNIDREKFDASLVAIEGEGPARDWVRQTPIIDLHKPSVSSSAFKLFRTLKKLKPDVVFTTMVHVNAMVLLMKPLFPKTKFIIRESSTPSALMKEYYGWKGKFVRHIYHYLYPRADIVISPSIKVIDEFKNHQRIDIRNQKILYNPVGANQIEKSLEESLEEGGFSFDHDVKKTVRFVCMGRLNYEKGFDRLIDGLRHLNTAYQWRLDIMGDGPERENLMALCAQNGIEDHVYFHGYQAKPWPRISWADALILPSRWEGMPNVALESLKCGTQVLALKEAGGIIEIDALTGREAVQTFETMNELIEAMAHVKPLDKTVPAPSMLPDAFSLPTVVSSFEALL